MWMLLLWCMCAGFVLTMAVLVAWNQREALRLSDAGAPLATPLVSVLIPARNEAANLPTTLPLCLDSTYPAFEVLVLDDQSTDQTATIVERLALLHPGKVKLLSGRPLPDGHNGKNWACQQLAAAASGEILLFCDADVSMGRRAISDTVAWLLRSGAGALTAIPHQRLRSWAEQAVVPLVMHVSTLGFVSLKRAFLSPSTALTVANGQWLALTRRCYEAIGGHEAVKDAIVEDMMLCKRVKVHGFRVIPALAFDSLSVRMYRSFAGVWEGFSKNLYGLMGYQPGIAAVVLAFFACSVLLPWLMALAVGGAWWWLAGGLFLTRLMLASLARHPWTSVLLHPLGTLMLLGLAADSVRRYYTGSLVWKERTLHRPGDAG